MIFNITQDKMREMALDWINPNEKNIIELGCADGNFATLLYNKGITNYIGIDIKKNAIDSAKIKLPNMNFMCCDICENEYILEGASLFVSFQCLEHIENDIKIIQSIKKETNVIISVPNSPYKGHVRWFELKGWEKRFSPYINFEYSCVIQNPNKPKKRSFLFRGVKK